MSRKEVPQRESKQTTPFKRDCLFKKELSSCLIQFFAKNGDVRKLNGIASKKMSSTNVLS